MAPALPIVPAGGLLGFPPDDAADIGSARNDRRGH
jgi:hypothetical protein